MDPYPSRVVCQAMPVQIVDKDEDVDQTRTVRPVGGQQSSQLEEIDIDFRAPGLSHAVVKEAEIFSVQELVKKIESHPHREALRADLEQNDVYNPFSNTSKEMIRELGNVELFQLCETIHTKSAMFSMSSPLESRNYLLHLRTVSWLEANPEESLIN